MTLLTAGALVVAPSQSSDCQTWIDDTLSEYFPVDHPTTLSYYSGRLVSVAAIVAVPLSPSKSNKSLLSPLSVQPCLPSVYSAACLVFY
ncbi:hypothetical protein BDP81DRAFT_436834 [Colletotrichum phormii]|uniref:Uncharacterized protein n=1 Tax=Colletotrichum phormii TaxID=359342 RepID=A0AAJ0EBD5_9PEZI|nr:uncharacterized protein BDP81DRAFT_436834 [Colletotrichum phormii]KAK1624960.1 hypothetical protein BDP81DRAFT_436834 [Colletotrichum phormii]